MGWAAGFQAGSQMAQGWLDTYREAEQRRRFQEIQEAKPEQGLGYTAEQGQELQNIATAINPETGQPYYQVQAAPGGLGYQVQPNFQVEGQQAAPVSYAPGEVTDFLGRRTAGGLTPQQESAARYSAYADVIARANPMEANRMRRELAAEERAQQEFQTGQELRGLQLRQGQRAEQADMNLERAGTDIAAFVQQNGRAPGMAEIRDIAAKNNLTLDQQFKLGSNLTGIAEADAKLTASDIQKKIKGKGLDGLLALHKDDPLFDDNSFFEKSVGKDGKITLTQRSKDGAVLSRSTFADSAEATAYLTQQATDPGNVFSWMQASRLNAARIGASEASAAKDYAAADYYREGRGKATGKTPATLTDAEKIAYTKAIEGIANLGPNPTAQQIAAEYRRFGLDPARFGVEGLPTWGKTEAGGLAPSAEGFSRRIAAPNVTARGTTGGLGSQTAPSNFVRERQRDGTYKYRDLATNKLYSTEEYNRLISR